MQRISFVPEKYKFSTEKKPWPCKVPVTKLLTDSQSTDLTEFSPIKSVILIGML